MIIKSHIRGGFRSAAEYLKEQGQNEKTRLVEMSDPRAKTLDEAFQAMWAVAVGTKAKKPIHHVSINPFKDERLTDAQVGRICERLEEKYGYAKGQHQRVVVEHIKDGRQHFHVIWNRVSMVTGRPHYPYMHKKQSKIAAREMEVELGLKNPTRGSSKPIGGAAASGIRIPKIVRGSTIYPSHRLPVARYMPKEGQNPNLSTSVSDTPRKPIRTRSGSKGGSVASGRPSTMGLEQWLDFKAACDGKITWRQYFQKWGGASQTGEPAL